MSDRDVQWTAKGPVLIAGIVLALTGLLATWRGRWIAAIVLIALGCGFIGYSLTIKDWCELRGAEYGKSAWGQGGFGGGIGECMREKGWFSL